MSKQAVNLKQSQPPLQRHLWIDTSVSWVHIPWLRTRWVSARRWWYSYIRHTVMRCGLLARLTKKGFISPARGTANREPARKKQWRPDDSHSYQVAVAQQICSVTSGPYTGLYIRSRGIQLCEGEQSTIWSVQACHSAWHDLVKCCLCCWRHKPCHPTCHAAARLAAVALMSHGPSTTNCGTLLTM